MRPRYIPHAGQATWGRVAALQFGQLMVATGVVFQAERRVRVLERDIFLLGTATMDSLSVLLGGPLLVGAWVRRQVRQQPLQRRPTRIQGLVLVVRFLVEAHPALRAQPGAVRTTQRPKW